MSRFRNKVQKRFTKNKKDNNKFIGSVNRLETIGYGYRKTFKGNNKLKYPYTGKTEKSRSMIRKDSGGLDEITLNERVGALKSPSMGNLGKKQKPKTAKARRGKSKTTRKGKTKRSTSTKAMSNNLMDNMDAINFDPETQDPEQQEEINKLLANWEHEYYHMMGNKMRPKKSKSGTRKKKSASSKRVKR